MKTKVEIRRVKPAEASLMLENLFEGQRHIRETHVNRLAEDMRLGRFKLSPDAIVVCREKTANGQHRLAAVVKSGLAQSFLVMETDDSELFKVLDSGILRTVGDVLSIENASQVAAVARLTCLYDKRLLSTLGGHIAGLGRLDVIEFAEANQEQIKNAIHVVRPMQSKSRFVSITPVAAAMIIGTRRDPDKTSGFVNAIFNGSNPGSPAWLFRERMIKEVSSKGKLNTSYRFGLLLKALRGHLNGGTMRVLKLTQGEEYPEVEEAGRG